MKSKQINKTETRLVRLNASIVYWLKMEAAKQNRTMRSLVEESLQDLLGA